QREPLFNSAGGIVVRINGARHGAGRRVHPSVTGIGTPEEAVGGAVEDYVLAYVTSVADLDVRPVSLLAHNVRISLLDRQVRIAETNDRLHQVWVGGGSRPRYVRLAHRRK